MSTPGPMREVLDDVRTELVQRRAQVLAWLTYLAIGAGVLNLMSSSARDSGHVYDSMDRSTVAIIGISFLLLGVLLGAMTLVVDHRVRHAGRRASRRPVPLRSRVGVVVAMLTGTVLTVVGFFALAKW